MTKIRTTLTVCDLHLPDQVDAERYTITLPDQRRVTMDLCVDHAQPITDAVEALPAAGTRARKHRVQTPASIEAEIATKTRRGAPDKGKAPRKRASGARKRG